MDPLINDSTLRSLETLKHKVKPSAQFLEFFSILLFLVSLFSVPFPFVRQIWLEPVVGALGFVNSGLLMWFANRIRKLVYPVAFAGLGLVFHEQLLAGRGFVTLFYHHAVSPDDFLFLLGTLILTAGLAVIFIRCLSPLEEYARKYAREFYLENRKPLKEKAVFFQSDAFVESVLGYGFLIAGLWFSRFLNLKLHFSACKIIAELTCVIGFYGIGREFELYLKEIQSKSILTIKSLSHLLVMGGVLWVIYRIMPIEPFLK